MSLSKYSLDIDSILWKGEFTMAYKTGEKPGKGTYRCTACGQSVILDDTTDTLPPCPRCSGISFTKG
ncbi:zinc ribbon-containing protein [Lactococcus cremoris]|uniref:zinc ribbon-containing protein n=1 Tax=Lactococcus lactis subsp. cremoris TaxID=1359 RepID=UPI0035CBAF12